MNICMFTNTYLPHVGGVARSVSTFVEDLRADGREVLVVAPTFAQTTGKQESDREVLRVPAIQHFSGSDFSVRLPLPFIIDNRISAFQPSIIHSHHPYLLGDAALRAARRRNLPLVFTHHTLYEKYTHYVPLESDALKDFAVQLSTEYANLCTQVIAPSKSVAKLIQSRGVRTPVQVLPTGIDIEFFGQGDGNRFRSAYGLAQDALVVGHVGRLAPEKNLSFLREAMELFLKKNPGAYFLVVGEGPGRAEIIQYFAHCGLEKQLLAVGEKTGTALADAYRAMDVFVFASKTETQGLVVAEAMAAGNGVVALDASGVREVLNDGENGRLLDGNSSPQAFSEAVEDLLGQVLRSPDVRQNAVNTAKAFSRRVSAKKLIGLYESVIRDRSAQKLPKDNELHVWDTLLAALRAEWELFSEKMQALTKTVHPA